MTRVRDAMIVAGGAGTRLWPLTAARPKPLVDFCDAPFVEGVLRRLAHVGVDRVLLIVGADPSPFEVMRTVAVELGIELASVPEPAPLDTAGGVRSALDRVRGTFLVLNGDILTDVDLAGVVDSHGRSGAVASLVLTRVEDTSTFGVCVLEGTRIVDFVEKPPPGTLPGQDAVNAGTYVLEPDALARFGPGRLSFEREVFPQLLADGAHVEGIVSDAVWADLGTPERFLAGHRAALDGEVAWPSLDPIPPDRSGVRQADSARVDAEATIVGPVLLGPDTSVAAGARIGPHVVLGRGSRIGAGTRLRDSVIGRGTVVGDDADLQRLATGRRARIGAQVRVTLGAVVGDDAVVPDATTADAGATFPSAP